ncbi:MAG: CDP-diacylglycerol--glycerol-3-phosphate 3-phosphatidyltransferase [Nitrospiraceae bacterium]|nr:CDP-diacylglycerol--glycerol-3-phosphate 3-phosphatidyltransferase [Nitrospiraceae bacterium]
MKVWTLPNAITIFRIVIIPVFVIMLVYAKYGYALLFFVLAGLSDLLDGLLARLQGQGSELGAFLDPLADKLLLLTSLIIFTIYGWIPIWFTIVVLSRDLIVVIGWGLVSILYSRTTVRPSFTGKAAIASQILVVAYVLIERNYPSLPDLTAPAYAVSAALTAASGIQYIYRELSNAPEK